MLAWSSTLDERTDVGSSVRRQRDVDNTDDEAALLRRCELNRLAQ